jgi:hypothetical protein
MKKTVGIIYFMVVSAIYAQTQVKWGVSKETIQQELATLNQSTNTYYSGYPLNVKKGQTIIIELSCKTENMVLMLNNAANETLYKMMTGPLEDDGGNFLKYTYTCTGDETLAMYIVGVEPGKKGPFTLNFYQFEENQINFKKEYSFCDRLAYIFNLCFTNFVSLNTKKGLFGNDYITDAKLVDESEADYSEMFHSYTETFIRTTDKDEANKVFNTYLEKLRPCFDTNVWIEKEESEANGDIMGFSIRRISFNVKPNMGADYFHFSLALDYLANEYTVKLYYIL